MSTTYILPDGRTTDSWDQKQRIEAEIERKNREFEAFTRGEKVEGKPHVAEAQTNISPDFDNYDSDTEIEQDVEVVETPTKEDNESQTSGTTSETIEKDSSQTEGETSETTQSETIGEDSDPFEQVQAGQSDDESEIETSFDETLAGSQSSSTTMYSYDELDSKYRNELKQIAEERGLDSSGQKSTLRDKILEDQNNRVQ